MVTFVCEYCDATLKKKQCDSHVLGRCRPGALICIDCSKTFRGNDYKNHISCISEMDKHWGDYAPSKKKNGNQNNINDQIKGILQVKKNNELQSKDEKKKCQQSEKNWKGWKNQIKKAIVEESPQQRKIQLSTLKVKVLKRYHEDFQQTNKDQAIFLEKLQKLKKVKLTTYVTIQ